MLENKFLPFFLIFLLFLVIINLFILDLKVLAPKANLPISDVSPVVNLPNLSPPPLQPTTDYLSCPLACQTLIQEATASQITIASLPLPSPEGVLPSRRSLPRESYIPLGSGSTSKASWDDITATETILDPDSYGTIKEAYFIASLRNPTQNGAIEAQLYNVTDKHPVWTSLVVMSGKESQTITSAKITLSPGSKLYRVQLKSTLSYQIFLDNAKIRIISE